MEEIFEDALSCPLSKDIMSDPVMCNDGLVYDRFEVVKALVKDPNGFLSTQAQDLKVTTIGNDVINIRKIVFWKYPNKEAEFKKNRENFCLEIEADIKNRNWLHVLRKMRFLRKYDKKTQIPLGDAYIKFMDVDLPGFDAAETKLSGSPSDDDYNAFVVAAFTCYEANTKFKVKRASPWTRAIDKYRERPLVVRVAFALFLDCYGTSSDGYTTSSSFYADCKEFMETTALPAQKNHVLSHIKGRIKTVKNPDPVTLGEWLLIWIAAKDIQEAKPTFDNIYEQLKSGRFYGLNPGLAALSSMAKHSENNYIREILDGFLHSNVTLSTIESAVNMSRYLLTKEFGGNEIIVLDGDPNAHCYKLAQGLLSTADQLTTVKKRTRSQHNSAGNSKKSKTK
jgi:hypothetical protein